MKEYSIFHGFRTVGRAEGLHSADRGKRVVDHHLADHLGNREAEDQLIFQADSSKSARRIHHRHHSHRNSLQCSRRREGLVLSQLTPVPLEDACFNSRISGYDGILFGFSQYISEGALLRDSDGRGTAGYSMALI
ncbi:hypothetical protein [Lentibacillus juripiscarius]|uniref:hypothetical protein n=1 Tax=Lentibacillus juripiscarius TaxID=257446 RepID=UPI0036D3C054